MDPFNPGSFQLTPEELAQAQLLQGEQTHYGQSPPKVVPTIQQPTQQRPTHPPIPEPVQEGVTVASLGGIDYFEWRGHTYRIGPYVKAIQAEFELYCERLEAQGIERVKDHISWHVYLDMMNNFQRGIPARKWAYRNGESIMVRNSPEGQKDLRWLMFKHFNDPFKFPVPVGMNPPPVTREMFEDMFEDEVKWSELTAKIKRLDDPNLMAPATKGAS